MNKSKKSTKATIVTLAVMVIWLMVAKVFAAESVERDRYLLLDSRIIEDTEKLAEGELITKTATDARIQWKDGFLLRKLKGNQIKLRFELRESKLYSFSFE